MQVCPSQYERPRTSLRVVLTLVLRTQAAFLGLSSSDGAPAHSAACDVHASSNAREDAEAPKGRPRVAHASAMAWDHAQPTQGSRIVDAACRLDAARRAGVCGDFFGEEEGVEAAALSGIALAEALAPLLT
eukprot:32503-Rhodomonas_salina.1